MGALEEYSVPDAEYTYNLPSSEVFAHTLHEYLKETEPTLATLIEGKDCYLENSGGFSGRRWNALYTVLHLAIPVKEMKSFDEPTVERLRKAADKVIPASAGFDVVRVEISPQMSAPPSSPDLTGLGEASLRTSWPSLRDQVKRLKSSENDPALLIGTAKDLVETTCKSILLERNPSLNLKSIDFHPLVKTTLASLPLVPNPSIAGGPAFQQMLSNLGSVMKNLGEIRNLHGTGHGRANTFSLESYHAKLSVNAATTMVEFLIDAHLANP